MQEFWNERYRQPEFAYGESPNQYLASKLTALTPGKILFPAEGEGRNAVYAAQQGWDVEAFDISVEGKKKADFLAQKKGVDIRYSVIDLENADFPPASFDAIALVFAHFPAGKRTAFHQKLAAALKVGGVLILEGFSKKHVAHQQANPHAGGPKDETMLYSLETLQSDFSGFDFLECQEAEIELNEGLFHKGSASVIHIVALKKSQL